MSDQKIDETMIVQIAHGKTLHLAHPTSSGTICNSTTITLPWDGKAGRPCGLCRQGLRHDPRLGLIGVQSYDSVHSGIAQNQFDHLAKRGVSRE